MRSLAHTKCVLLRARSLLACTFALCATFLWRAGSLSIAAAAFGVLRSQEECKAEHERNDYLFLNGDLEPAFSTGPPADCDSLGCLDGFWGPRSRFEVEPTCPKDIVKDLTVWLRQKAKDGSPWARDALLLQPCDLWQHLRGRTTWVIGDSVTEAVGAAISTFMLEYWDKEHWEVSLTNDERVKNALMLGIAEGAHGGGKRVPYWCFQMGSPTDPGRLCYIKADRLKRSLHVLNLMPSISQPNDVMMINIGTHYNDMENLEEDMALLGFALGNTGLPRHRIWVETPPQHYETASGMFNMTRPIKEQMCFAPGHFQGTNISIFTDGSIGVPEGAYMPHPGSHAEISLQRILAGGDRNLATQPLVDAAGLTTLRTWNLSLPLWQFHTHLHLPGEGECDEILCDCTHNCFPSSPQIVMASFPRILKQELAKHRSKDKGWHGVRE